MVTISYAGKGVSKDASNVIIGGGPAGLFAASKIKAGITKVFEEHHHIGRPVQCAGIVTSSIKEIVPVSKGTIINRINKFIIMHSPDTPKNHADCLKLRLENPNLIIDREKFDLSIRDLAEKQGAEIHSGYRYLNNNQNRIKILDVIKKKELSLPYNTLIGADGPMSAVAKNNSLYERRKLLLGIQFRYRLKEPVDKDTVIVYPSAGKFGWLIPEDETTARIGLVAEKSSRIIFHKFLKDYQIDKNIKTELGCQSGLIPSFSLRQKYQKENVFLVGDSASMIKNTSYGGLIHGLKAADILARCINEGNPSRYAPKIRKPVLRDLKTHYYMRNMLDQFESKDWQLLIDMLAAKKVRSILETHDRDYPKNYLFRLLLAEPRLLYFLKYIFHIY